MAAPQIGIYWRVVIVALGNERTDKRKAAPPIALINPQIIDADDEQDDMDGCLSFPGLYGWTTRPHHLR
ncbi:MAG: peptide deformylase, partial [Anaerolineales bacterium]